MKIWLSTLVTAMLTQPLLADVPKVVTDIAPVHSIVARIMQGVGEPELIVPPAASPHDHAMRPSEARALAGADVVVWVGPGLTPWLQGPIEALAGDAEHLRLQDHAKTVLPFREGATFEAHEHHDDHDEDHDKHEDHDDHDAHDDHADGVDPHMWLDPLNAVAWGGEIAVALAEQDPENADTYAKNAEGFAQEIAAMNARISMQLTPLQGRPFVVFHDAYHYFEARYGVEAVGAISASDAQAPSPRRLREIEHLIEDTAAVCVFAEPQFNTGLARAVASSAQIKLIDPIGIDLALGPQMYAQIIQNIADQFVACLGE